MNYETHYLEHMARLVNAAQKADRTGTGTQSIFGHQIRHDLRDGFPLLTTKKVFTKGIIHELLWFLQGSTNIQYLLDNNVHIWDGWATESGDLGPVYGEMWRSWPCRDGSTIDQITSAIVDLKKNPNSRRNIVSGWNPEFLPASDLSPKENAEVGLQALPPCHTLFQFNCEKIPLWERVEMWTHSQDDFFKVKVKEGASDGSIEAIMDAANIPKYHIDVQLYQRSADWLLGVPFNAASYSLLLMMVAQVVNMSPRYFIHTFGDTHLYLNHIEQAKEQLSRTCFALPKMKINNRNQSIDDFVYEDFELVDYNCHPAIKAEVSI